MPTSFVLTPQAKKSRVASVRLTNTLLGFVKAHKEIRPTDFALALAEASTKVMVELHANDDFAAALIVGAGRRAALLGAEGGCVRAETIAKLLDMTKQAVHMRRRKGGLLAVATGKRSFAFPVWQVHEGRVLDGIPEVIHALASSFGMRHDVQAMRFLLGANPHLSGRRPLDLLRNGEVEAVLEAAATYGVQGG
jgi:hypothetical protein